MKTQDLAKKIAPIAAVLGVILLVAALGAYLIVETFDLRVLVPLAVGAALLVLTAAYYPREMLEALRGRSARYGSNTLAMIIIFIVIIGLVNFLSLKKEQRWDLTENGQYSLSQQTVSVLSKLEEPVKVTAFYASDDTRGQIEDLLKEYHRHTDKIDYQFIDPVAKPVVARDYKVTAYGTTVLEYKGKRQDMVGTSEQDITSALLKLIRGKALKVYFLAGHGEAGIEGAGQDDASQLKTSLEADNYEVSTLTLATVTSVPSDAAALIIAGPQKPYTEDEKKALVEYLNKGGKALVLLEPGSTDSLNDIMKQWGVDVKQGVVFDVGSALAGEPRVPLIQRYAYSPITKDLVRVRPMTALPLATSVLPVQQPPQGVEVTEIMQSSERSWLETDPQNPKYDEGIDTLGPLTLALTVEGNPSAAAPPNDETTQANEKKANTRLVVIGDVAFATNEWVSQPSFGNRDLVLNSVNWLVEEEEMISIRAKDEAFRPLFLTGSQMNFVFYTSVIFLPMVVLAIGGWVWWKRR